MSQATEPEQQHGERSQQGQRVQTTQAYRTDGPAVPPAMKAAIALVTVAVLVLLGAAAVTGAVWAFPFVYVPVAIAYIAGSLYLFKRLMDYSPATGRWESQGTS
jgi:fatty acid desaturase